MLRQTDETLPAPAGLNPATGAVVLKCSNLVRTFGALRAVDDLSFTLREGEVLGVGGPNGAGKTTMFDLVGGLTRTSAGKIELMGEDVTSASADIRCQKGIARTFQMNAGFDGLTAIENVYVPALFGAKSRRFIPQYFVSKAIREQSQRALERVGLADKANVQVANLTVLDRKLLMIAGAIVTEPNLLMMDEPVGGLTPPEIAMIGDVVRSLKDDGMTILLIEHVMQFLMSLSDRVLIMHQGAKLFEGAPEEVCKDQEVVRVYLGEKATTRLQHWFERDNQ